MSQEVNQQLNLPHAELRIEQRYGHLCVWDHLRRRWIVLTPEEYIRQQFTHWMTDSLGYPSARLALEVSLELNGMKRRCDAVFYDRQSQPQIIIEFKAPHIHISQQTFNQICRYNMAMHVPLLIVSNGISHYCARIEKEKVEFLREIPPYKELQN